MTAENKLDVEFFYEWSQYDWETDNYKHYTKFFWKDAWDNKYKYDQPMIGACCGAALKSVTKSTSRPIVRRGITIFAGHLGKTGQFVTKQNKHVGSGVKNQVDHVKCKAGDLTCVIALEDPNA